MFTRRQQLLSVEKEIVGIECEGEVIFYVIGEE